MDFTRITDRLNNVSDLPDVPSLSEGWTPEELKAQFDKAGVTIGAFINDILIPELEAYGPGVSGAEKIGSEPISGIEGHSVRSQLVSLRQLCALLDGRIREVVAGGIPDGTIGLEKFSAEAIEMMSRRYTANLYSESFVSAGNFLFTVPRSGLYRIRAVGAGAAGNLVNSNASYTGTFNGRGGASGSYAEVLVPLVSATVLTMNVGRGGETVSGITVGQNFTLNEYNDYVNLCSYTGAGSGTTVRVPGVGTISCSGADPENAFARTSFGLAAGDSGFTAPIAVRGDSIVDHGTGRDSRIGQGGTEFENPGPGAGGSGGRIFCSNDDSYTVRTLPRPGADGAVLIEYIGG
ncbi:MAG: hypothetical protein IJV00_08930 [Clostridia bacterium]|nr:hypothetical protein [Clostridia bacterium]